MPKLAAALFAALLACPLATPARTADTERTAASPEAGAPDSVQLEKGLQSLTWKQFRSVVDAIPKLKADVDAYGALGWEYVKGHYRSYRWRKSIGKLDADQKQRLGELIAEARSDGGKPPQR